jgi:hypothetical protein
MECPQANTSLVEMHFQAKRKSLYQDHMWMHVGGQPQNKYHRPVWSTSQGLRSVDFSLVTQYLTPEQVSLIGLGEIVDMHGSTSGELRINNV